MKILYKKGIAAVCRIAALYFMAFLIGACPVAAEEEQKTPGIHTWADLQEAINESGPGELITLTGNLTALSSDSGLMIPAGKHLTLDLNGYVLDRNLDSWGEFGSVIQVNAGAVLTVRDSSASGGTITGGYHNNGGGILNRGTLILESGRITGNTVLHTGGGISNDGTAILLGGSITGNEALLNGGGVCNKPKGHMTICADVVSGNQAPENDEVFNQGTLTLQEAEPEEFHFEDMTVVRSYMEELAILPFLVMLAILLYVVWIDSYLSRERKRIMLWIVLLVLSLILQNYTEYRMSMQVGYHALRIPVSIYGYAVRPVILILFLKIIKPERRYVIPWLMAALNALVYMTAFFSGIAFYFTINGSFSAGPLHHTCTIVSGLLLGYLFVLTIQLFDPVQRKESWLPVFVIALIIAAIVKDFNVVFYEQPVSFLTMGIVISSVFYYIWLHLQFVREHEKDLQAEQRIQIMKTQIQPHFLYNTLMTIQALCRKDPERAYETTGKFGSYLRQNLAVMNQPNLIPLRKELEHTRTYADIEMLRFPNIHMQYDITDDEFQVPPLTIQPLVENAIRHGVRIREEGIVSITTRRIGEYHEIEIRDNGIGFDPESVKTDGQNHIGIHNVRERIEKMCGGTLTIESHADEGTKAVIRIPRRED